MRNFKKTLITILLTAIFVQIFCITVLAEDNSNEEHVHDIACNFRKGQYNNWYASFYCRSDECNFYKTGDCDITTIERKEPTCTEDGYERYLLTAEYNGESFSDTEGSQLSRLGHDFSAGLCSRCGTKPPAPLKIEELKRVIYSGEPCSVTLTNEDELTGKITYTYYTDYNRKIKTTPENSGSSEIGGPPVSIGSYYVTVTYAEDEYYRKTTNKMCKILIKPTALTTLSVSNHEDGIQLSWEYRPNAARYTIYRRRAGGTYKKIGTIENSAITSCIDTSATSGKYYYNITVTEVGADGSWITSNRRTYARQIYRNALTITNNTSSVKLKWTIVPDAEGYYIYRKTKGQTKYSKIKTITNANTTTWTDSTTKSIVNGRKSTYYVKAYFKESTSAVSKSASVVNYYLSRPSVWQSGRSLDWSTNKQATGYQISRTDSLGYISTYRRTYSIYKNFWSESASLDKGKVRAYKEVNGVRYYSAWSKTVKDKRLSSALK